MEVIVLKKNRKSENIVAVIKQNNYSLQKIKPKIEFLFSAIGAAEALKGKSVIVKPNCTGCFPPELGRTTHPVVLKALIETLLGLGAKVVIGESSTVGIDTFAAYKETGILAVAEELGVKIIDFKKSEYVEYKNESGLAVKKISLPKEVSESDYLISLAKLKTNYVTTISCAMKNLKGLLKDEDKRASHHIGLAEAVADIYNTTRKKIKLIALVDGIIGSELYEPRKRGILIASNNLLACDMVCAQAMGIKPKSIKFLNFAKSGKAENIKIIGEGLENYQFFKTCEIGLKELEKKFNVKIIDGNPCTNCAGSLYDILNKLKKAGQANLENIEIAVGACAKKTVHQNTILFGSCASKLSGSLKVIGCPPGRLDFIKVLNNIRKD